jgi:hypothetical protein
MRLKQLKPINRRATVVRANRRPIQIEFGSVCALGIKFKSNHDKGSVREQSSDFRIMHRKRITANSERRAIGTDPLTGTWIDQNRSPANDEYQKECEKITVEGDDPIQTRLQNAWNDIMSRRMITRMRQI